MRLLGFHETFNNFCLTVRFPRRVQVKWTGLPWHKHGLPKKIRQGQSRKTFNPMARTSLALNQLDQATMAPSRVTQHLAECGSQVEL